ncbi:hypothetical protein Enr13x_00770 [Stieleria neptunia]|uniref:Uncharacterized protein n=1 Tax=Stieleria neptunia TaxID=2527979 RepID=A0A518HHE9_9BACT|nr:hypothetical protein Enr13x_00770 [Stieleria neptunia]
MGRARTNARFKRPAADTGAGGGHEKPGAIARGNSFSQSAERRKKVGKFRVGKRMPERRDNRQTPCSLFLPQIFLPPSPTDASPAGHHQNGAPLCIEKVAKDANAISRRVALQSAGPRRTTCPFANRPLHNSLARSSSASRCKPRFDLTGALQTSKGVRRPRIGATCVRSESSFSQRKTPSTTRRE